MNYEYNREDILRYIESRGFSVRQGRKIYRKNANIGYINWSDTNLYFFKSIPAPFTDSTILFSQIGNYDVVSDADYIAPIEKPVVYGKFSNEFYYNNTTEEHQLSEFLGYNEYECRGILGGSYDGCTIFPYIDINQEFRHGKVARYNSKTGRRVKGNGCNIHAFHAMKQHWSKGGYKEQPIKPQSCFFGEHLLKGRPDTPVIIVESEKTAIQMSSIFADCDVVFLAVGGLSNLKNMPKEVLEYRRVMLQPDEGAEQWIAIANAREYARGTIIEHFGAPKTDIGDYFEDGADATIRRAIEKEISDFIFVGGGEPEHSKNPKVFGFEMRELSGNDLKSKTNLDTKALKNANIIFSHAYDEGIQYLDYYVGRHFLVYPRTFRAVTANTDFNKSVLDESNTVLGNGWRIPTSKEFLERLEKTFKVIYALNYREGVDVDYIKDVYKRELRKIEMNGQFRFSVDYVMRTEVRSWILQMRLSGEEILQGYYNDRDWTMKKKKKGARPISNFNEMKNIDRRFAGVWLSLRAIKNSITTNRYNFLGKETLGVKERRTIGNPIAWGLIDMYNERYLGVKSCDVMSQKRMIYDSIMEIANESLTPESKGFIECSPIGFKNTKSEDKAKGVKQPTIEQIRDITDRRAKERASKSYKTHKPSICFDDFLKRVEHIIDNTRHIEFDRIVDDDSVRYEPLNIDRILNLDIDINLKQLKDELQR